MKKGFLLTAAMACVLALAACGADTTDAASENLVYGTATLTYAEFFSGDVSSTDSFDAVSSATTSKYEIMPNMDTDFVDETANADGYHITGVKNVNVAVSEADYEAYQACNPTFVPTEGEAPAQYKVVTMEDGAAVCRVEGAEPSRGEPTVRATLFMALPKGDKIAKLLHIR